MRKGMSINTVRRQVLLAGLAALLLIGAPAFMLPQVQAAPAKGKPKPPPPAPVPAVAAPADLNDLSLRVVAMETIYELDLSPAQLSALRVAGGACVEKRGRAPAKGTPKLTAALKNLYAALATDEHDKIADLREQVADLADEDGVDLDDVVTATDAARTRAPEILKLLKAGQIAAYLADHADEIADPAEVLMDALSEIREPDTDDPDGTIQETAEEVGRLVAGADAAKAKQVADQAAAWLKAGKALPADAYAARHDALAASAGKIIGDVPAMVVLTHWLEGELADLLANPQLTGAIDATIAGKK
jgi:hypothetical protein